MNVARELAEETMTRVQILWALIEDMYKNVEALKEIVKLPDGIRVNHDLVVYQAMEVKTIMGDLLATIPEDAR